MNNLNESSPSVLTHLNIIQNTIQRMATNSSQCKTWCITIVSAILVMVANNGKPESVWIATLPTFLFFVLDVYYLGLEKGFVKSYNEFIEKLHQDSLHPKDLYSVESKGGRFENEIKALESFSVWAFYLVLITLIAITRFVFLA